MKFQNSLNMANTTITTVISEELAPALGPYVGLKRVASRLMLTESGVSRGQGWWLRVLVGQHSC